MAGILGPYINISEKPSALDESIRDVLDRAYEDVTRDVKSRVQSRLDTGVDLNAAVRASSLKVEYDAGRIVINTGQESEEGEETTIHDLFQSNMEPPTEDRGKIIFKQIKAKEIERKNEETVIEAVKESMLLRFPDHFSNSVKRVQSESLK